MSLDRQTIYELKSVYLKEFGIRLSKKEVWDMAVRLINLCRKLTGSEKIDHKEVRTP
jgi:hypothetical protein